MSLARHVNPDEIIKRLHCASLSEQDGDDDPRSEAAVSHLTPYTSRYASQVSLPKFKIPKHGAESDTVYAMIRDELDLDGKPNLNLASFVGTYVEETAEKLMVENMAKNLADSDEYPAMIAIHQRCVSILAHLWGVQEGEKAIGSATTGSSEAIQLGGLAMKRRWQERRRAEGKDASRPNILMGANAQVALEKFARYFDVEARILPVSAKSHYRLDPDLVRENLDENTIGVFVILGSTYTGHYEPVEEVSRVLDRYQAETGIDIPIHVDGASGAFIAPFTHAGAGGPKWDFHLPRVKSINASGHKYGLVTAGVGWIVWRDESYLPEHLIFELHYLGGTEQSFTLNFSRPGAQVITQYYNLIHLGFDGYRNIMESCLANARLLSKSLEATGWYTCVSDIHRPANDSGSLLSPTSTKGGDFHIEEAPKSPSSVGGERLPYDEGSAGHTIESLAQSVKTIITKPPLGKRNGGGSSSSNSGKDKANDSHGNRGGGGGGETSADYVAGLPVVSFHLSDELKREFPHVRQETVSLLLRARQWIVPNYALPPGEDGTEILRVVVRESLSLDLLDRLVSDICEVTQKLMDDDEVDLDILRRGRNHQDHPRAGGKEKEKGTPEECERARRERRGGRKHRMADGIHRSVC
ncbi:glutamate decarboxylase [Gaeumannomyces tritici R3-111a-1]|uniref:Glutamate decarboxylase n=1 Tax=Gaeumannomyces tritici (strain R3-111a-1) TaxID=644352 RepID=J3PDY3_GAET3|nr:glutamate decarboxylase [Gaeumannomyces tritici R3-111a-1]EJT70683.1 glutamate decarboxylase [Gaeumannomyces tritici R3-111a-1]